MVSAVDLGSDMKIWHDDLGVEKEPYELRVRPTGLVWASEPGHWQVTGGDAAVAAEGNWPEVAALSGWFETIWLLMSAGF